LYQKKANQIRVWTAVDRNRLRFAGFEVGDASSETLRKFWSKIAKKNQMLLKIRENA
jgi:IS1 family transposase